MKRLLLRSGSAQFNESQADSSQQRNVWGCTAVQTCSPPKHEPSCSCYFIKQRGLTARPSSCFYPGCSRSSARRNKSLRSDIKRFFNDCVLWASFLWAGVPWGSSSAAAVVSGLQAVSTHKVTQLQFSLWHKNHKLILFCCGFICFHVSSCMRSGSDPFSIKVRLKI